MATTLYLNPTTWDLDIDASGNIAVAQAPYQLSQDACSAMRTVAGECWYDTTQGIPYLSEVLGKSPPLPLLKSLLEAAALTVPGIAKAQVFITSTTDRGIVGQVQITDSSGSTSVASF